MRVRCTRDETVIVRLALHHVHPLRVRRRVRIRIRQGAARTRCAAAAHRPRSTSSARQSTRMHTDPRVEWTCVPFRPFLLVQRLTDGVARPSCAHALRRQRLALCVAVFHAPPRHPLAQNRPRRVRRASGIPPPCSDPRSSLGCPPSISFRRTWTRARRETHPCPRRN